MTLVGYDAIQKAWIVERNGTRTYRTFSADDLLQIRKHTGKSETSDCSIYLMRIGPDTYKAGCSSNLHKRLKAAKTWCPDACIVAKRKVSNTASWRRAEMAFLKTLTSRVGKSEVVRLTQPELKVTAQRLRQLKL